MSISAGPALGVGEGSAVEERVGVAAAALDVGVVVISVAGREVKSPALAGLTLNCRIGQNIKVIINKITEDDVRITPLEYLF
jgi:hypothetical protein